ncbi:MAG: serine/threonine protein kinase [Deltaproteobacteria bacterium]|nr:serine/threonine protein kinase [Deltaproteobacteria bacterium]
MDTVIYRWLHRLGSGTSGIVWAAERQGETLAVKVLRVRPGSSQAEAIRRELKIGPLIDGHPGVVAVRREEIFGNSLCLEMDLIKGPSLAQVLEDLAMTGKEGIPASVAVAWMVDVLETLDWVGRRVAPTHPRSFAHRDIKPSNLLLDPTGRLRISDFGIARAEAALGFQVTKTGVTKGTPRYLAPEALLGKGKLDARADQFAVGSVLYELLTGRPLYEEQDVERLLHQIEMARVEEALSHLSAPPALVKVLRKMLARDPGDRYPSHRSTANALTAVEVTGPAPRDVFRQFMPWAPGQGDAADIESSGARSARFEAADEPGTDVLAGSDHETDEVTSNDLAADLLMLTTPSQEDDGPTMVGVAPPELPAPSPSTIGGWLYTGPSQAQVEEPEHTVGGWLRPALDDVPEHTVGEWLLPEHEPEHTVGEWLLSEPDDEAEHTVGEWLRPELDEEPEHTVGEWLRPEGAEVQLLDAPVDTATEEVNEGDLSQISATNYPAMRPVPLAKRSRGEAVPHLEDTTLNISHPLHALDQESTHILPSLAYSQRLPASMDTAKQQRLILIGLAAVVLLLILLLVAVVLTGVVLFVFL